MLDPTRATPSSATTQPQGVLFRAATALVWACLLLPWVGCSNPDPLDELSSSTTLRLGHGLDTSHPVHLAMEAFAQHLEASSEGRIQVVIYPSEQLGSEREMLELLQIGSLDITKTSASVLESFASEFRVFNLPYLFRDREHLFETLDGPVGRELLIAPMVNRLRGLCYYDAGSRSFYTRERPVLSPDDLTGLKIRTQESASAIRLVGALGGSPTPIAWGELYSALQQGVVDGAENNPPSFYLSRHYEVCRHYVLDEHTAVPDVLLIGTATWDRLTGADQKLVDEAAEHSSNLQRQLWATASQEALDAVIEAGVTVHRPDKRAFAEKVRPLLEEAARSADLGPWVRRIQQFDPSRAENAAATDGELP